MEVFGFLVVGYLVTLVMQVVRRRCVDPDAGLLVQPVSASDECLW